MIGRDNTVVRITLAALPILDHLKRHERDVPSITKIERNEFKYHNRDSRTPF